MDRERRRGVVLAGALAGSVALSALLALQAYAAGADHRRGAEQVLRDFARLSGHELARRSAASLGYDGFMVALEAATGRLLGDPAEPGGEREARARGLVRRTLGLAPHTGATVSDPAGVVPPALLDALRGRAEPPRPFQVVDVGGSTFVLGPGHGRFPVAGFELEPAGVEPFLQAALSRGPLLPPSLGDGRVTNEALSVVVRDPAGVVRLRHGGGPWPGLEVEVAFEGAYGGALDGWSARVAIDPAQARRLVIGGLPGSRLGALLVQLALAGGLAMAARLLIRRESAVARLREEFVQSVSHELRTPLTQIRMFAEMLLLGRVRDDDERQRAVAVIDREARRLGQLVENILQASRAEREAGPVTAAVVALAPLVRQAVEAFRPLADSAEATLVEELDAEARAAVDGDAVQQVVQNLLANAAKYGPRGQTVTVALVRDGSRVTLTVRDQGPGIPAPERVRVFERFSRLARDRASSRSGTGLGLAVVAELARRHGGGVVAEDAAGGGACVGVWFPSPGATS